MPATSRNRCSRWRASTAATRSFALFAAAWAETAAPAGQAVAGSAIGAAVLLVAIHEIRDLIVHRDVIHLGDRELDAVPGAAAIDRDADAAVVRDDHAIAVGRVDPHVVVVAAWNSGHGGE